LQEGLKSFVDACNKVGLAVILDSAKTRHTQTGSSISELVINFRIRHIAESFNDRIEAQ
jgi:hypothetical protein